MEYPLPIDIKSVRKGKNLDKLVEALEEALLMMQRPVQIRKYGALDESLLSESFSLLENESLQREIRDGNNNRIYFPHIQMPRNSVQKSLENEAYLTKMIFSRFLDFYQKIGVTDSSFLEHAAMMAKEIIELNGWEKAEKHSLYRRLSPFGAVGIDKSNSIIEGLTKLAALDDKILEEIVETFSNNSQAGIGYHPAETVPLLFGNSPGSATEDLKNKTIIFPIYDVIGYAIYGQRDVKSDWLFRDYESRDPKKQPSKDIIRVGNAPIQHQDLNEQASEIIGLSARFLHQCGKTQRFAYAVTGWPLEQLSNIWGAAPFNRHTSISEDVLIYSFRESMRINL